MGNFLRRRTPNKDQSEVSARSSEDEQLDIREIQKTDQYKKGISHMSDDKMEDAIRDFDLALRLDPSYVDAWIKKGYAHFHLDEFTTAISCYDKALESRGSREENKIRYASALSFEFCAYDLFVLILGC